MPGQPTQPSPKTTKQDRRRAHREEELRQATAQRRATLVKRGVAGIIVGVVLIVAINFFTGLANRNSSGATATQPSPTAASASTPTSVSDQSSLAPAVDGVLCNLSEQLAYHIHAHLSIYISGKAVPVSESIGITSSCIYWLHTHDTSGIIHIESPTQKTYTLGNFLDLWQQQFSQLQYPAQLDQSTGWQVYVNGKLYADSFRSIPLNVHTLITLAYQSPGVKPDTAFNWGDL
ncbi:MAG TPA: hypothetical protein VII61_24325 [Ktedonobacteraceae bacterium]